MKAPTHNDIQTPQIPKRLPAGRVDTAGGQVEYTGVALVDGTFENLSLEGVAFEQVRCRHVLFIRAKLPRLRLLDARLEVCDLTATNWEEGHVRRTELVGCRMWGADLYRARLQDVLFYECNAEDAAFAQATCRAVRFERCNLSGASFAEADLSGVIFDRCDLSQADLRGAKLVGADLRGSILDGLRVNAQDLRGVIVEPAQAVPLVTTLGLEVRTRDAPETE